MLYGKVSKLCCQICKSFLLRTDRLELVRLSFIFKLLNTALFNFDSCARAYMNFQIAMKPSSRIVEHGGAFGAFSSLVMKLSFRPCLYVRIEEPRKTKSGASAFEGGHHWQHGKTSSEMFCLIPTRIEAFEETQPSLVKSKQQVYQLSVRYTCLWWGTHITSQVIIMPLMCATVLFQWRFFDLLLVEKG